MSLAQNTTLCYLERDGAWLMLHRIKKKNDCNHDKWIGVGGKFEACESPEECLLREVKEETGVTLTRWRYRGIITFVLDGVGEYMHLFTADQWEGEPACGDSAEGVLEWVDREKVPSLPIWEGDKIFFRLLAEEVPFFSLKLCYQGDTLVEAALNGRPMDLDRPTVDALHWAEREICEARRDYVAKLAQAVYIAHDALCGGVVANCDNSKHGHRGEDAFRNWCASVGLGKDTAYRLLQVAGLLNGATPEDIEELVTRPLESAIMSVPGVESVSSTSSDSVSQIQVTYVEDTDLDIAATKLREEFDMLSLPDGATDPVIVNINISEIMPSAIIALMGDNLASLQSLAEDTVAPALERIDGVASVTVSGGVTQQIEVQVDAARAAGYGLSNSYISQFLAAENLLDAGRPGEARQLLLRAQSQHRLDEEGLSLLHTLDAAESHLESAAS